MTCPKGKLKARTFAQHLPRSAIPDATHQKNTGAPMAAAHGFERNQSLQTVGRTPPLRDHPTRRHS